MKQLFEKSNGPQASDLGLQPWSARRERAAPVRRFRPEVRGLKPEALLYLVDAAFSCALAPLRMFVTAVFPS